MAASTGPDVNTYQIPNVELGDNFAVWRDTTNTQTYKLNKIRVYEGVSSSSILMSTANGGTLSAELADNIAKGVTFLNSVVFNSGVTFNGEVTFNASTFTVNANAVTIDDYAIVLGSTAGTTDGTISSAGGGGLLLNRGTGTTAEWLWKPDSNHGTTGAWKANASIGFDGVTFGIVPHASGVLPVHGTGLRLDGGGTAEHGLAFNITTNTGATAERNLQFLRYAPEGSTVFMEVYSGTTHSVHPFVNINNGVNRKIITQPSHGFNVGAVVRFDSTDYVRALGNSSENAEVIGIVSRYINTDTFELTFIGEIFGDFSQETDSGLPLTPGRTYYLSPYTAGKLSIIQPTASGAIHKAVLIATSATSAIVIPFTGGVLASPINIANASSVATRINQINRFSLGDIVRFKAYPAPGITLTYSVAPGQTLQKNYVGGVYVKGQANGAEEAEIAGMVVARGGETGSVAPAYEHFDILMDGFFDVPAISPTLTPGSVYFLSTNSAGTTNAFESGTPSYTITEPSSEGTVRKPLFMATGPGSGYLFSYRGDVRGPALGVSAANLDLFLVKNILSGVSGDLKIGVYDTSVGGKETITLSTGFQYDANTVGACGGYVGIGGGWSPWNSGTNSQSRILANLDVNGTLRLGKTLPASNVQGQDLIVMRHTGDSVGVTTMASYVVVGTEYDTANLIIGRGVRPQKTASGLLSTLGGGQYRSALLMGVSGGNSVLRWAIAENNNTAVDGLVTLVDAFSVTGNAASFSGTIRTASTTASTSTATGALIVAGGVGVGGALYATNINSSTLNASAFTDSTSTTTGALTVAGGVGVVGALNVGGGITAAGNIKTSGNFIGNQVSVTGTISTSAGDIISSGGITASGTIRTASTTASTSTTTGALTVAGGVGVVGALYVGGGITAAGNIHTASALTVAGVVGVGGGLSVSGNITANGTIGTASTTASTSTSTGALTVGGGVGVGGALNVGNFGSSNVLAKLNNTVVSTNTPSVGCVVPLHANYDAGVNTTPLPAGTWFVYLTGIENTADDEDTHVVMAKVWTVGAGNYLRFKPSGVATGVNAGIQYSNTDSTAVNGSGTFTAIAHGDAYAMGTAFETVFTAGTHKGLVYSSSTKAIDFIHGFAIRIA